MISQDFMSHKNLDAWQKAMDMAELIYKVTESLPKEEQFGLISQMRRSVVSIPSNIAEGATRQSNKEYIQFLYISLGSASELETQILLCNRLGFMPNDQANKLIPKIENIIKVISGLIRYRKKLTPR